MNDDDARWEKEAAPLFKEARAEDAASPVPAALARAKAGVRERLEAGRRPTLFPRLAIAGALAAVAIAVVVWKRAEPSAPSIVVAEGALGSLRTGDRVELQTELSTGASTAVLALGEQARVLLFPGTRARLVSASELGLIDGRAKLNVKKGPFRVGASTVTLEVVGTVFEVACYGNEVTLMVSEGVVRAMRGTQSWNVKAGETWPPPPVLAPPPAPIVEPERQQAQLTQLEQAQELTRQGKLDAARAIYGALAKEDGSIAELALYHLAHLEQTRAHRPKVALEALDQLLARFPNGALEHEAKLSRIEALRALGLDGGK